MHRPSPRLCYCLGIFRVLGNISRILESQGECQLSCLYDGVFHSRPLDQTTDGRLGANGLPPHQDFLYPNPPKAVIVVTLKRFADDN